MKYIKFIKRFCNRIDRGYYTKNKGFESHLKIAEQQVDKLNEINKWFYGKLIDLVYVEANLKVISINLTYHTSQGVKQYQVEYNDKKVRAILHDELDHVHKNIFSRYVRLFDAWLHLQQQIFDTEVNAKVDEIKNG